MDVAQLKDLLGTIATLLFILFCVIGVSGAYIVGTYKNSLLNDRLKESIATLNKVVEILNNEYQDLSRQKTIVVIRDKETGEITLKALNTTPEKEAKK